MVIASPGVQVDLEVSLRPNQDTEQGLSPPIVTQESTFKEVPSSYRSRSYSRVGVEDGIAEAAQEVADSSYHSYKSHRTSSRSRSRGSSYDPTVGPAGPTLMIATIAGVGQ